MVDWKTDAKPDLYNVSCAFLETFALRLKADLKERKLSDAQMENIVETATFGLAMMFDQGRIKVGDRAFKPVLGFRDQVGMVMQKKVSDPNNLHEDAFNMVSSAFDDNDW